jgi:hypothetical protein
MPAPAWKSAKKAAIEMMNKIRLFFMHSQLRESFGSSDGCGTRMVYRNVSNLRARFREK